MLRNLKCTPTFRSYQSTLVSMRHPLICGKARGPAPYQSDRFGGCHLCHLDDSNNIVDLYKEESCIFWFAIGHILTALAMLIGYVGQYVRVMDA